MNLADTPVIAGQVASRQLAGEAVLVHPLRGEIKVINEVGARIWSLVDGARTVGEIAACLSAEYDVTLEKAQADVLAFLQELEQCECVVLG